ncbi:MAG: hypothetical protein I3270_02645 [Candidatus Moeniiplasma glomeromycotorum]|nr:hypothetical protein [Candidatus Moeniiplasma glomeromycotorum]MCE8162552.1 hypothetical protein [Candidatus Moeniiplasma glomeromycotorum]MCE8166521.1 hypothetical protein [Candidatus Moeniiplasma glomeromycotorum]MCE8167007.1 hypothetical protein [Candidatus Moeniiplasma glomeromycotorum]
MNSFKITYNQIENKIREFKVGVDYHFTGEKYYAPNGNMKEHYGRTYQIKSPQLNQIIQSYLQQQSAIFMSFDFNGLEFASERIRPDNLGKGWKEKYHALVSDENGDVLDYGFSGEGAEAGFSLSITYWSHKQEEKEEFNKQYQTAKQAWEAKGSPLNNIPLSGVKCWSCYEVISDADIAAGHYLLENNRIGKTKSGMLTFFKNFEHVKGVCKPLAYDCALRNNYRYHSELIDIWLKTYPQKKHEYSCQDCLTRMWYEVNGNLIYLETWEKERMGEIDNTKQVLAEIKARLAKLKESGQFHNCRIKKCCAEHDRPNHSKPINNKGLITTTPVEEELFKPKKPDLDRQTLLNWMKEKGITEIYLSPSDPNQLSIKYGNGEVKNLEITNDLPEEWGQFIKQEVFFSPISLKTQNSPTKNNNNWGRGVIAAFSLLAVGLVAVVGILIYRPWKLKK